MENFKVNDQVWWTDVEGRQKSGKIVEFPYINWADVYYDLDDRLYRIELERLHHDKPPVELKADKRHPDNAAETPPAQVWLVQDEDEGTALYVNDYLVGFGPEFSFDRLSRICKSDRFELIVHRLGRRVTCWQSHLSKLLEPEPQSPAYREANAEDVGKPVLVCYDHNGEHAWNDSAAENATLIAFFPDGVRRFAVQFDDGFRVIVETAKVRVDTAPAPASIKPDKSQWEPQIGDLVKRPTNEVSRIKSRELTADGFVYGFEGTNTKFTAGCLSPVLDSGKFESESPKTEKTSVESGVRIHDAILCFEEDGSEALYIDKKLVYSSVTIDAAEIAACCAGKAVRFWHRSYEFPVSKWPENIDDIANCRQAE